MSKWIQYLSVDAEEYVISLQDEKASIFFGPSLDAQDEIVPPFYLTLNIHDFILYNCMLDSRESHNLMQNFLMDQLQFQFTGPYHDLYTFDSKKVHCLWLIK